MGNQNIDTLKAQFISDATQHRRFLQSKIDIYLSIDKPSDVLIIKSHLICEYYLDQILIIKNSCPAKELRNLTFFKKMNLAFNSNNVEEKNLLDQISELNKLRNKVGHELEYTLSESDIDALGFYVGKDYIFRKYDLKYANINYLLGHTLGTIVIEVSMFLFKTVSLEKLNQK